jgi:hypothetical protein
MPFEPARIEIKPAAVGTGIKASLKRIRGAAAKLSLTVTGEAMRELGWAKGDRVEVLIGTGSDHGLIRLRKNNSAGQATVNEKISPLGGKPYQTLALGHQPAFVNRSEGAQWCRWESLEDGWVEVVLPRWADETGPNAKAKVALPSTATQASLVPSAPNSGAAGSPPKNVTAGVMGDPPPGRREMLAKMGEMKA